MMEGPRASGGESGPGWGGRVGIGSIVRTFERFFRLEAAGGIVLLGTTAAALVWANSPAADGYFSLWRTRIAVGAGELRLSKSLLHWINDGLMALFFLLVGLELKRETLYGELSSFRAAALPVAAAVGGMAVPAAAYVLLNPDPATVRGWAIPMATDIAFALGVLALLGKRVPPGLKIFLAALAIADDLGAVMVIALFYTSSVSGPALLAAGGCLLLLVLANRAGADSGWLYGLLGLALWVAVLKSGVHATVAGVLLAMAVPAGRDGEGLLIRMEHALLPWVAFGVVPLFALANAGLPLEGVGGLLASPVAVGIAAGLFLGKQVGVTGFAWLAVRARAASLPAGVGWRHVYGAGCLCGIGFTMSIFIGNLAFAEGTALDTAKAGILLGSVLSGVLGFAVLAGSGGRDVRSRPEVGSPPGGAAAAGEGRGGGTDGA